MPSLIESHIQDHCKTAADVRRANAIVRARRKEEFKLRELPAPAKLPAPPPDEIGPDHALMQLVDEACFYGGYTPPRMIDIQRAICVGWNISLSDLLSIRRSKPFVLARQSGMLLCRLLTLHSLPEIGRAFDRDHTTVFWNIRSLEWMRVALLNERLNGRPILELAARTKELFVETPKNQRYAAQPTPAVE